MIEPIEAMAEAALALCCCDPEKLTGRITYSLRLLESSAARSAPSTGARCTGRSYRLTACVRPHSASNSSAVISDTSPSPSSSV